MNKADAALGFHRIMIARGVDGFEREVALVPGRRYRWDLVHRRLKIAIEIQGGIHMRRGGHNTAAGIQRDAEKLNLCVLQGYRPLFFTTDDLRKDPDGCIDVIRRVGMMETPQHETNEV